MGFSYQKNFFNPTLPVDEAQFWALVRATKWGEAIDECSTRQNRRKANWVLGASRVPLV